MVRMKRNLIGTRQLRAALLSGFVLVLAVMLASCNDEPAHCTRAAEGEFLFGMVPETLDQPVEFTATVSSIQPISSSTPPVLRYLLRTDEGGQVEIRLMDIGFTLPVNEGASYRFVAQMTRPGNLVLAEGLKIYDETGLLFLGVSDWLPNFAIFADGYGDMDGDGQLRVFHQDGGCKAREENSARYHELRNYRLEFLLGDDQRVRLWQGEQGRLGRWLIHVHKALHVEAKEQNFLQNQISFFVQREDIS